VRVILQGSLRFFSAGEMLTLVAARPRSGTLDAESGEKRVRLFFRDGKLEWAEGSAGSDAQSLVTDLVGWTDGTVTFLDALDLPQGITPLALDAKTVVDEAERRVAEAQRLLQIYPDDQIVFRVVPKPAGNVSLQPDEFQLLFQIGNGKSLAQLRAETKRSAVDLYPAVHRLQSNGLIEASGDTVFISTASKKRAAKASSERIVALKSSGTHKSAGPVIGTLTTADGAMHPLLDEVTTVGRVDGNAIVVADASVSSKHARLLRSATGFAIEDVGSRNGTFVNGDAIKEPHALADGDVVRIGKVLLTFNLAAETKPKDATQPEMSLRNKG
jgi:hypothetical protein